MNGTNGWRIAGRSLGPIAFLLATAAREDPIGGLFAGVFWWGILEFIGWLVDRERTGTVQGPHSRQSSIAPAPPELSEGVSEPRMVFNSAKDAIQYEEYKRTRQAEVLKEAAERRQKDVDAEREREVARAEAEREYERSRTTEEKERAEAWAAARKAEAQAWAEAGARRARTWAAHFTSIIIIVLLGVVGLALLVTLAGQAIHRRGQELRSREIALAEAERAEKDARIRREHAARQLQEAELEAERQRNEAARQQIAEWDQQWGKDWRRWTGKPQGVNASQLALVVQQGRNSGVQSELDRRLATYLAQSLTVLIASNGLADDRHSPDSDARRMAKSRLDEELRACSAIIEEEATKAHGSLKYRLLQRHMVEEYSSPVRRLHDAAREIVDRAPEPYLVWLMEGRSALESLSAAR